MSGPTTCSQTLVVLHAYFNEVVVLDTYLAKILIIPPQDPVNEGSVEANSLLREGDSQEYRELLITTYVGLNTKHCERFIPIPPMMYMRDVCRKLDRHCFAYLRLPQVIQKAHELLLLASRARANNIIALGYQRVSVRFAVFC